MRSASRAKRARALLERGELPTTEVAFAVGIAHPSHLARWMRRVLGVAPGELRRARKIGVKRADGRESS